MKPRRWYSSPEVNPHPVRPAIRPLLSQILLTYAARTHHEQGAIIRYAPLDTAAPTKRREAKQPTETQPLRRIDAA